MFFKKNFVLKPLLQAVKCGFVTFISIVGIIGMILMYAPNNVIDALYWSGFLSAITAGLIKYLSIIFTQKL